MKTFADLKEYLKKYQGDETVFLLPHMLFKTVVQDDEVLQSFFRKTPPISDNRLYDASQMKTKYRCLKLEIDKTTYVFVLNRDSNDVNVRPFTEEDLV